MYTARAASLMGALIALRVAVAYVRPYPLRARLGRLHDDLTYRTWCSPEKGLVGSCELVEPRPYERHALGTRPACRWCHRETRA